MAQQHQADYEIDIDPAEHPNGGPREDEQTALARRQAAEHAAVLAGRIAGAEDRELAGVQAAAARADGMTVTEGTVSAADESSTVEFMGRRFRVADKIGIMPLLKFSQASSLNTGDPRALAAIYEMLRDCIHEGRPGCGECAACKADRESACALFDPGDWAEFERHATDTKADADELFDVITKVMEIISGRPPVPRGGSSPGQPRTRAGSTARGSGTRRRASRR